MKKIAFVFASLLAASSAMATETQPVAPQAGGAVAGGSSIVVAGVVAGAAVVTIAKVAGEDSPTVEGPDGPEVTDGPETTTTNT